jgi:hypothetical protein
MVTFSGFGQCEGTYDFWPHGPNVFGAAEERFAAVRGGDMEVLTAAAIGAQVFDVQRENCDACVVEASGTSLATLLVTVKAATIMEGDSSATTTSSPLPKDAAGCPTVPANALAGDVSGTATQEAAVFDAVAAVAQQLYGSESSTGGVEVTAIYRAVDRAGYGIVADSICGKALGDNSYVVELHIPNAAGSASIGSGQVFVAQFVNGWQVWFRYR